MAVSCWNWQAQLQRLAERAACMLQLYFLPVTEDTGTFLPNSGEDHSGRTVRLPLIISSNWIPGASFGGSRCFPSLHSADKEGGKGDSPTGSSRPGLRGSGRDGLQTRFLLATKPRLFPARTPATSPLSSHRHSEGLRIISAHPWVKPSPWAPSHRDGNYYKHGC